MLPNGQLLPRGSTTPMEPVSRDPSLYRGWHSLQQGGQHPHHGQNAAHGALPPPHPGMRVDGGRRRRRHGGPKVGVDILPGPSAEQIAAQEQRRRERTGAMGPGLNQQNNPFRPMDWNNMAPNHMQSPGGQHGGQHHGTNGIEQESNDMNPLDGHDADPLHQDPTFDPYYAPVNHVRQPAPIVIDNFQGHGRRLGGGARARAAPAARPKRRGLRRFWRRL